MAALALGRLLGAFLDAMPSTVSYDSISSNESYQQLVRRQQAALTSPNDVSTALGLLVDTLISRVDTESQGLLVSHLAPFLVDVLYIIKGRARALQNEEGNGTAADACIAKISICCFLARVAETLPHLTGAVKEIVISEDTDGLLQLCPPASCTAPLLCAQMRSFRSLLKMECISGCALRSQVGQLLVLTGSEVKALIFESLLVVCCIYRIPDNHTRACLQKYLDDQVLGQLYYEDCSLASSYVVAPNPSFEEFVSANSTLIISPFCDASVYACGYVLPRPPNASEGRSRLVMTSSAVASMSALLEALLLESPFIVQGETGSGRSFLLLEAARLLGAEDRVVELHLDDQMDSKALLGSYVCGDVPGEFVWREGIVTKAVRQGHWLVIESIDKVSIDVISALASLLDNKKVLGIWNQPDVPVHPSFRLVGVRQIDAVNTSAALSLLPPPNLSACFSMRHYAYKWHFVTVLPPSLEETREILKKLYPELFEDIADLLVGIYSKFKTTSSSSRGSGGGDSVLGINAAGVQVRSLRLSDLMKVASRLKQYSSSYNHTTRKLTFDQRLGVLKETIDVFAASVRSPQTFLDISYRLAQCFGISKIDFDDTVVNRAPSNDLLGGAGGATVTVGRITLPRSDFNSAEGSGRFAVTQRSFESLERLAACVSMAESVLLVGETGSGKTTLVQELATLTGNRLLVQNLSLTTDSADFLGGVRPVKIREVLLPLYESFLQLFKRTFSSADNAQFLGVISESFRRKKWKRLLAGLSKASLNAIKKISDALEGGMAQADVDPSGAMGEPREQLIGVQEGWLKTLADVERFESNLGSIENGTLFAFQDGLLLQAVKSGYWILLDEVNLAASEVLQGLGGVLDRRPVVLPDSSGLDVVPVHPNFRLFACMNPPTDVGKKELPEAIRNKFTEIYVNEMTDYDDLKRIVARYVDGSQLAKHADCIIQTYLDCRAAAAEALVDSGGQQPRYSLRTLTRSLRAAEVFSRAGMQPFSRALHEGFLLTFEKMLSTESRDRIKQIFTRNLGAVTTAPDAPYTRPKIKGVDPGDWILIKPHWLLCGQAPRNDWAERDGRGITRFVVTPSVQQCVSDVVAAVVADVAPVLLQGPTSVGKTTIIEYLAARCGRSCIRINNHEHTDVQEYIGTYITNARGALEFNDGLLVRALRLGHWVILDELNLAPSDVLEALNRLLDDNRELLIPETGELVRPHEGFRLFATQNPAGAYGGRKPLSRAFRNRFVEISFCDLPGAEIEEIVGLSCGLPPQYSKILVSTMVELQRRRQLSSVFQGKHGMVTMRDLLKWGRRGCSTVSEFALEGYMLLAERLRTEEEQKAVEATLRVTCKVFDPAFFRLSYELGSSTGDNSPTDLMRAAAQAVNGVGGIALTKTMRRMWSLVSKCLDHQEPVLLIGDTGTGKTTVCQLIAALRGQHLTILNCHQSTEAADIIGGYRPVRNKAATLAAFLSALSSVLNWLADAELVQRLAQAGAGGHVEPREIDALLRDAGALMASLQEQGTEEGDAASRSSKRLKVDNGGGSLQQCVEQFGEAELLWTKHLSLFEWQDGPLVTAMKNGDMILLDELNLAEDAVIERLNSVLESGREITLVEQGGASDRITAGPSFRLVATMNPGNDFGKRELSPALRSRFSEIWVPQSQDPQEVEAVINELLFSAVDSSLASGAAGIMVDFASWLSHEWRCLQGSSSIISVREIVNWTHFISQQAPKDERSLHDAIVNGAHVVFFDCLGVGLTVSRDTVEQFQLRAVSRLISLLPLDAREELQQRFCSPGGAPADFSSTQGRFCLGQYSIAAGPVAAGAPLGYSHTSSYAVRNFSRVLRAMQIRRPVLLEGPPGVGKTTLITSLAALSGNTVVRINLSEQTELSDLLGSDLPADEADDLNSNPAADAAPKFCWRDGVFLDALKRGHWVLLDELNLAPQSVLEGLNACFDHREEVFIPELGRSFASPPTFRVFCTQNPTGEGGGRKGLPASFLSRFSRIYVDAMTAADMTQVVTDAVGHSTAIASSVPAMVQLVFSLQAGASSSRFGASGSPWEFNIRDVLRWCELAQACAMPEGAAVDSRHISQAAFVLFSSRLRCQQDRLYLSREYERVMANRLAVDNACPPAAVRSSPGQLRIGAALLRSGCQPRLEWSPREEPLLGGLATHVESLAHCVALGWPALLVGAAGVGKHRCVRHLAALAGACLHELAVTSSTDSSDLLGSFEQSSRKTHLFQGLQILDGAAMGLVCDVLFKNISLGQGASSGEELIAIVEDVAAAFAILNALQDREVDAQQLETIQSRSAELLARVSRFVSAVRGCYTAVRAVALDSQLSRCGSMLLRSRARGGAAFEWVDGVITNAAEKGHWVLIDNANLCSASVLDRLNALLEPGGRVVLSESGADRVVVPHSDFRVFLSMDPQYGEVSRAMRNRCVEICLSEEGGADAVLHAVQSNGFALRCPSYFAQMYTEVQGAPRMLILQRALAAYSLWRCAGRTHEAFTCRLPDVPAAPYSDPSSPRLSLLLGALRPLLSGAHGALAALLAVRSGCSERWFELLLDDAWRCLANRLDAQHRGSSDVLTALEAAAGGRRDACASVGAAREVALQVYAQAISRMGAGDALCNILSDGFCSEILGSTLGDLHELRAVLLAGTSCGEWLGRSGCSMLPEDPGVRSQLALQLHEELDRGGPERALRMHTSCGADALLFMGTLRSLSCLLYIDRATVIGLELDMQRFVRELVTVSATDGSLSLYCVGYAMSVKKLVASSKPLAVIRALYSVLVTVDALTGSLMALLVGAHFQQQQQPSAAELLPPLRELLARRDTFAQLLVASDSSAVLPWPRIIVGARWVYKAIGALSALVAETSALYAPLRSAKKVMDELFAAMGDLWRSSFAFSKVRLWKEGGHVCVPATQEDWSASTELRSMLALTGGAADVKAVEAYHLLLDWLGLYSSLYLPRTLEGSSAVSAMTGRLSFKLLASLADRFSALPLQRTGADIAATEIVSSDDLAACTPSVASHLVMCGMAHISDLLASLLLQGCCSDADAAQLRVRCKEVLCLGLRYSPFPVWCFREMQALQWAFEPGAAQGSALVLARAMASVLDHRLASMALLQEELLPRVQQSHAFAESCAGRLARPAVARRVLTVLDLSFASAEGVASTGHGSVVTMGALLASRKKMFQLFRLVKASAGFTSQQVRHFARVELLRSLCLDVVASCRDFYSPVEVRSAALLACESASFADLLRMELHTHTSSPLLSHLFTLCLQPLLRTLADLTAAAVYEPFERSIEIGTAWIHVGILRANLVLPPAPVDPALKPQAKAQLLREMVSSLERSVFAQSVVGVASHGVPATPGVLLTAADASEKRELLRRCELKKTHRPKGVLGFDQVYLEMQDALQTLVDAEILLALPAKMRQLHTTLIATRSAAKRQALFGDMCSLAQQEANWQRSFASLAAKLSREMLEYEDIASPFLAALHNVSVGLALAVESQMLRARDDLDGGLGVVGWLWGALTRFPHSLVGLVDLQGLLARTDAAAAAATVYAAAESSVEGVDNAQAQLAQRSLAAAVLQFVLASIDSGVGGGSIAVDECYPLHKDVLARLAALEANENSITTPVATPAVASIEGALALQESFDVPEEGAEVSQAEGATDEGKYGGVHRRADAASPHQLSIISVHARMLFVEAPAHRRSSGHSYSILGAAPVRQPAFQAKKYFSSSLATSAARLMKQLAPTLAGQLSPGLDAKLCAPALAAVAQMLRHMGGREEPPLPAIGHDSCDRDLLLLLCSERVPADFRQDANYVELLRASDCVRAILRRASQLLELFPDNEYLAVVYEYCNRMLAFDASSSVGKVFENATQLLKKVHSWQQFASREHSLAVEQQALVALIADWRRQQLGSWEKLLRLKEVSYVRCAARYWQPLSRVLREALERIDAHSLIEADLYAPAWLADPKSASGLSVGEAVAPVFELINNFLNKSNLGQFPTKLHLVRMLALQLAHEETSPASRAMASLLFNVWQYYEQFLHPARSFQDAIRAGCDSKVAEEVKMAKWDRVETYMESESVERSLRKIKGVVADYQSTALEHPVSSVITSEVMGDLASRSGEIIEQCVAVPSNRSLFPSLRVAEDAAEGAGEVAELFRRNIMLLSGRLREERAGYIGDDSDDGPALADIPSLQSYPQLLRTRALLLKMSKYIRECLAPRPVKKCAAFEDFVNGTARFGLVATRTAEELCDEIFGRISTLQATSSSRAVKQHALRDLLAALREQGVSHLRSDVPAAARNMSALFAVPSPLLHETSSDLLWSSAAPRDAYARAEAYHYRNIEELNQLRAQTSSVKAKDMSLREAQLFLGLSENLFFAVLRTRCSLGEQLKACLALHSAARRAEAVAAAMCEGYSRHYTQSPSGGGGRHHSELRQATVRGVSALADSVLHMQDLLAAATSANEAGNLEDNPIITQVSAADCTAAAAAVAQMLSALDGLLALSGGTAEAALALSVGSLILNHSEPTLAQSLAFLEAAVAICETALQQLQGARGAICSLVPEAVLLAVEEQAAGCLEGARTVLAQLTAPTNSPSPAQPLEGSAATRAVELLAACLDSSLIGVQKLRLLRVALGDGSSAGSAGDQLCQDLQSGVRSLDVLGAGAIASSLQSACNALAEPSLIHSQQLGMLLGGVQGVLEQLLPAHAVLLEDLCSSYKASGKLLYVCLRIFRNLLSKGYCSPDKEEEGEGEGEGDGNDFEADGTGMGEGEGAKDVTDEITNEEQLLGLQNEEEADSKQPESKKDEEEDRAIEMSQDFEGTMEDVEGHEEEDEEEGEEELDRQMGDADDTDVVDEKQWGSDDEEEGEDNTGEEKDEDIEGADEGAEQEAVEGLTHTREEGDKSDGEESGGEDATAEAKGDIAEAEDDAADVEEGDPMDEGVGDDDAVDDAAADGEEADHMDEESAQAEAEEAEVGSQADADGGEAAEEDNKEHEEEDDLGAGTAEREQDDRYEPTFGVESDATTRPICETEQDSSSLVEKESSTNRGNDDDSGRRTNDASTIEERNADDGKNEKSKSAYIEPPNPLDSQGDFNEKWERRLNLTESSEEEVDIDAADDTMGGNKDVNEYEFANEETYTDQTLSTSRDNRAGSGTQEGPHDEDSVVEKRLMKERQKDAGRADAAKKDAGLGDGEEEEEEDVTEDGAAASTADDKETGDQQSEQHLIELGDEGDEDGMSVSDSEDEPDESAPTPPPPAAGALQPVSSHRDAAELRRLWQEYQRTTEPYSIQLCERLRLVLEPTLASRLKGDYKSGKRLSMRKIIGYVASGYKKDKIWLRRTRLAKRDYQIVLMIDNSSSMREAGHLAMSSVFTLAGALSRLEAGDISVVSFGREFETIHPFGSQINENTGAKILQKFDFAGDKTLLGASLEKMLAELAVARASSASSRIGDKSAMQLAFVVSDARIDSDNRLQITRTIKALNEQGVLVVLVIIDSCADEQDSVLRTKTVSFKDDKVVTTAYLDTVPFPYYVLIQNISALPDVIADTLKQWFQLASASSN